MIPVETLDDGFREALNDIEIVRDVMMQAPNELDNNFRTRQANVLKRIKTGGVRQKIRVLRDLCWREHIAKLTQTDMRIRNRVQKRIQREIKVAHNITSVEAKQMLKHIIQDAMLTHENNITTSVN